MNIGDRLYCHTNCVMKGGNHSFSLNMNDDEYWKKWFCDIRELRKIKLEKIKEVRKCLS